ncbi:hypothetical protein ACFOYW_00505 [Gryllotalpicola reticulitermitis]|uniref:DUF2975 domain-containing protein n=1 Tax=Gryllotalpicola reticulitermitis TaxID=1184153 RepID=A0ABV8Q2W7_9MICO
MDAVEDAAQPLHKSGALRFVFWVSAAYLVVAAIELSSSVAGLVSDLRHRVAGIAWSWDPAFPVVQPSGNHFAGGPYLVPGSTAMFTQVAGTVANIPAAAIISRTAGDVVGTLTGAGIAACLLVLMSRVAAGAPFARSSQVALLWLAGVVLVGFELGTILHGIASAMVTEVMMGAPKTPDGAFFSSSDVSVLTLWPVYVAMALVGLAAVFRVGAAYRADSDGLV